jgi:uncharacterized membrane protein (DUF373 family)
MSMPSTARTASSTTTRIRLGLRATAVRLIERLEEGIYLIVAVLLVVAAIFLVISATRDAITEFQSSQDPLNIVLTVLDKGLVLFMVAELLHTVRITVHERALAAEPFLIVGLIAGIRRVLILTAQTEGGFNWNPQGIQLLVLTGLVLVMAVAILVWRRSERMATAHDRAER